jgi:alanine racemase
MLVPPLWGSMLKAIPDATVDGFVVVGLDVDRGEIQLMRRRDVPFVMVDSDAPDDVPSVNVDDRAGARAVMSYILNQGHRRIAIICIEAGTATRIEEYTGTLAARLAGYREALEQHGLALAAPDIQMIEAATSWEGGQTAFEQLWNAQRRPTAIVAMSDIMAIGVMDAARARKLHLPRDLSVAGFDDLPDARHMRPGLTTVRQPVEEKGRLAADVLVAALAKSGDIMHHMLPTELVIRQSVAAVSEGRD